MIYAWSVLLYLWAGLALESYLKATVAVNPMESRLIILFWPIIIGYTVWLLLKWVMRI